MLLKTNLKETVLNWISDAISNHRFSDENRSDISAQVLTELRQCNLSQELYIDQCGNIVSKISLMHCGSVITSAYTVSPIIKLGQH